MNFDDFQLSLEHKNNKPSCSLHDCFRVLGLEDNVAEYYQQQIEMLEGFNEMDALAERGFILGMSKEEREKFAKSETLAIRIFDIANMVLFATKVYASVKNGSWCLCCKV